MSITTSTFNAWIHLYAFAVTTIMLSACNVESFNEKFEEALKTGNLTEAELHLKKNER